MRVEKESERNFYIEECIAGNWSPRQLKREKRMLEMELKLLKSKDKRD
jgi:predicted nuclease of restriction endonuclease-like (RecB) superfamily